MADDGGQPQSADDASAAFERWQAALAERQTALREDARAVMRALKGWGSIQTQEDWEQLKAQALEDYHSGGFLLERLGAELFMEPEMRAVLLTLRRGLIADLGAVTHAELMVIDAAILAYYNLL